MFNLFSNYILCFKINKVYMFKKFLFLSLTLFNLHNCLSMNTKELKQTRIQEENGKPFYSVEFEDTWGDTDAQALYKFKSLYSFSEKPSSELGQLFSSNEDHRPYQRLIVNRHYAQLPFYKRHAGKFGLGAGLLVGIFGIGMACSVTKFSNWLSEWKIFNP